MQTYKSRLLSVTAWFALGVAAGCNDVSDSTSREARPAPIQTVPIQTVPMETSEKTGSSSAEENKPESARTSDDTAYADDTIGIAFPKELGGLVYVDRRLYYEPGAGYSLRYDNTDSITQESDFMKIDIYVYDETRPSVPAGHDDPSMLKVIADTEAALRDIERRGIYHNVKKLAEGVYPDRLDGNSLRFQFSRFQFSQALTPGDGPEIERVSETFVRGVNDHFIKLRVTYPKSEAGSGAAVRKQFIEELVELLQ